MERIYHKEVIQEKTHTIPVDKIKHVYTERLVENPQYVDEVIEIDEKDVHQFQQ